MSEEVAIRIVEALESIKDAIWIIAGLVIFFGVAILTYILTKD